MTSHQSFRDNLNPLTNHQVSILESYANNHDHTRVQGYLDGITDIVEYIETRVLLNEPGNFRPLSKDQMRTELQQLCRLAKEVVQTGPYIASIRVASQSL